ncbi:FAD-dependent oxidoreductase [Sporosarcina thermotolerans]|uniref:FAD-dependent oxidoreductase n=1 Tax=Sporosarcina thermotolerans TaxID=633404 RepID=A0AAW9ADG6_9BACL|nr:FAD-dependent oxidoreductase [Sporosarcina thermotolerans]MDW0117658.1 FAD-dependent oxidoreductase [Sporosarcina thermotolerans]
MSNDQLNGKLPEHPEPYWRTSVEFPTFPSLQEDIDVDVIVVGAGITGITSAYLLASVGLKVAMIEADKVLNGTTGNTTAKITAQHDLIYDEFIHNMGRNTARLYYEANMEALEFIKETVEKNGIDCDFTSVDAYIYSVSDKYAEKIKKEAEAYQRLQIRGGLVDSMPFDIDVKNVLVMKDQAQFHVTKYLVHLIDLFQKSGGQIFEDTVAVNIETGERPVVLTREEKRISAKHVLICTHFPFYEGTGLYSTRMYADRSYALAVKSQKKFPPGIFISADEPTRSLRSIMDNGEELVLIVGENHKTGQSPVETMDHYRALEMFGEEVLGLKEITNRWSAQDLVTLDKLPYIGEITSGNPNILIATGFRKWGMSNGTAAALLFRDMVTGKENKFEKLYTPSRFYAHPSLKNFLVQNANVVGQLIKGKLDSPNTKPEDLAKGEGAVITLDGHRKGAYRDDDGKVHIVDTTCTHIGCEVEWNNGDKTWDCPCHGSRFKFTGEVIEGPAEKPLQKYDYTMMDNLTSEDSGY